jgi:hypothetical protein
MTQSHTRTNVGALAIEIAHGRKHRKQNEPRKRAAQSELRRLAGRRRVHAATNGGAPTILRIPITNIYDGSDYSATLAVGSRNAAVNVILDTGSSTLGVDPKAYNGASDTNLAPTTFAQIVTYGTGGWAGPVVLTTVQLGGAALQHCPVAIADVQEPGNFQGVTGILGLAYYQLNDDYDFKAYLTAHDQQATYPWKLATGAWTSAEKKLASIIKADNLPQGTLTPYFDQLENSGVVANKFAFYVKRSWVSLASQNWQSDPLNQGVFVLGGGEEQTDLYQGQFADVAVLDDVYFNTNLKSVQVGNLAPVAAAPLQAQYQQYAISNSIVDSGTSDLSLAGDVYNAILSGLKTLNPAFAEAAQNSAKLLLQQKGVSTSSLNLADWPNISFVLTAANGSDVTLTCAPSTYWQTDFPEAGQAVFQISGPLVEPGQGPTPNQSILGLPLFNNYYTVFDRSQDTKGVIRFAPINLNAALSASA